VRPVAEARGCARWRWISVVVVELGFEILGDLPPMTIEEVMGGGATVGSGGLALTVGHQRMMRSGGEAEPLVALHT
jgi:hypothetical protein